MIGQHIRYVRKGSTITHKNAEEKETTFIIEGTVIEDRGHSVVIETNNGRLILEKKYLENP